MARNNFIESFAHTNKLLRKFYCVVQIFKSRTEVQSWKFEVNDQTLTIFISVYLLKFSAKSLFWNEGKLILWHHTQTNDRQASIFTARIEIPYSQCKKKPYFLKYLLRNHDNNRKEFFNHFLALDNTKASYQILFFWLSPNFSFIIP